MLYHAKMNGKKVGMVVLMGQSRFQSKNYDQGQWMAIS